MGPRGGLASHQYLESVMRSKRRTASIVKATISKLLWIPVETSALLTVSEHPNTTHSFLIALTTTFVNGDTSGVVDIVAIDRLKIF
jgi:hypothetical protein